MKVAAFQCSDFAFCRAQFEKEFLLVRGGAYFDERPRTQNVILYRRPDPPHRVSGKAKAPFGLKAVQCLHQANVAFGHYFRNGQTVAAIAHGDFGGEPEVTCDELVCRVAVTLLAPAFGELVLLVPFEHRKAPDVIEIAFTASTAGKRQCGRCSGCEAQELSLDTHICRSVFSFAVRNSSGSLKDRRRRAWGAIKLRVSTLNWNSGARLVVRVGLAV